MSALGASKRCPQCGALAPLNAPLCATCGREFEGTVGPGAPESEPALPPGVTPIALRPRVASSVGTLPHHEPDGDAVPAPSDEEVAAGTRLSLGLVAIFVVGTVGLVILGSVRGSRSEQEVAPASTVAASVRADVAAPEPIRAPVIASPGDVAVEEPASEPAAENATPGPATSGPAAPRPIVPGPPIPGPPTAPAGPPVTVAASEIVPESTTGAETGAEAETQPQYSVRVTLRNDGAVRVIHARADVIALNALGEQVLQMRNVELLPEGTTLAPGETATVDPGRALTFVGRRTNPPTMLQVRIVGIDL